LFLSGSGQTPPHDDQRPGPVPRSTLLVPVDLRNAGTLPPTADPVGERRQFGRHPDRLRRQSERQRAAARVDGSRRHRHQPDPSLVHQRRPRTKGTTYTRNQTSEIKNHVGVMCSLFFLFVLCSMFSFHQVDSRVGRSTRQPTVHSDIKVFLIFFSVVYILCVIYVCFSWLSLCVTRTRLVDKVFGRRAPTSSYMTSEIVNYFRSNFNRILVRFSI
jgi:hypothetical protein